MRIWLMVILVFVCFQNTVKAESQQDSLNKKRLRKIVVAESAIYAGSMTGLAFLWYKDSKTQSFQFFNDNKQWLQMDKLGHIYTAYHLSNLNFHLFKSAGLDHKKAMLYGSITSSAMMLPIELFDGFSRSYGASWGDALANTIGALLPYQRFIFSENYFYPKFSFSPSPYAGLRPRTLGTNYIEQVLKDYNGQTYWLSTDFNLFSSKNKFPEWLQFSIGYSGNNMIYGSSSDNLANGFEANRQLFFSLDLNMSKIEVEQQWLKMVFKVLNTVKIPFPAIEWNGKRLALHPIYF